MARLQKLAYRSRDRFTAVVYINRRRNTCRAKYCMAIKNKEHVFAVTDDGQLAGIAGCVCDEKEKLAHIGHVMSVYVKPEHRGQGIGRQLLMAIIEYARDNPNIKKLELGVITTETAAYALYTSVGFKKVGELSMASWANDRFYDEYLMEMVLK